jgi:hypothetical protein
MALEAFMKKSSIIFLLAVLVLSLGCQTLFPATPPRRDGMVINNCADITKSIRSMQTSEVPQGLMEIGIKQGDEFDVNDYFIALPNLSMQEGFVLDYVYQNDGLGAFPIMNARPADLPPYATSADVPQNQNLENYSDFIEIKDVEAGYFEFMSLLIMANQFYLVWHANYNDMEIICHREAVDAIVADINDGEFGGAFDKDQMRQIKAMQNIEPLVKLTDTTALVDIVTFSKWGGFYRMTYTIDRSFPHKIIDVQEENIVLYDCGIMF